jgi:hypothetical protein
MADIYIGKQETCYREKRRDIINYLHEINDIPKNHYNFVDNNETVIDVQHDYIRLHDSINSWVGDNGKIVSRRKIELSYQDLLEKSIEDIVVASEV